MQWTPNGVYVCVLNRYHNMINCESYFCSLIQEQPVDRAVESTSKWRHWYFPFFGGLRLPGVISPKSGLQACMRARKSKQAKKPARKQASQPASKQASNEQPASEQASKKGKKKKASQQATKPVCHPYPNGHGSTRLSPQSVRFMRPEDIATEFCKCTVLPLAFLVQ